MTPHQNTNHPARSVEAEVLADELRRTQAELRRLQATVNEQRTWSRSMFESLGEGLIAVDAHGRIITINPRAATILGYEPDELVGKWFSGTVPAVDRHGRLLETMDRPIVQALSTGQTMSEQVSYIGKTGELIPVAVTVSPIVVDGTPAGAIEVFRDLTQERQLDIAKEEFVSLASHQLRTPATAVKSILSMLGNGDLGPLSPVQQKFIDRASQANSRQLEIIEDMLSVARIDAGRMERQDTDVDLTSLVRVAVTEQTEIVRSRGQQLQFVASGPCIVRADEAKLRMVVDNLISNASKYTPSGGKIRVEIEPSSRFVVLKVQDTGLGIATDDIPRLFKKFSRINNHLSHQVGGNGLGLFLVKSIVELHGGTVSVASRPGEGSEFSVVLPQTKEFSS